MDTSLSIDIVMAGLLTTTEALAENVADRTPAQREAPEALGIRDALMDERQRQVSALGELLKTYRLDRRGMSMLTRIIEAGEQAREPVAIERELLREKLLELRATLSAQTQLKPYRRTSGRRLNVSA